MAATASPIERIRMQSCANKRAAAFLTTSPKDMHRQLSNSAFGVAVRSRLHLSPLPHALPAVCECGAKMDPVHVHHCATVKSEPCVVRHNTVVEALAAVVKSAGLTPYVEPRRTGMPHDALRKRPDIIVYTARETLIIDVSLLHPLSPSYVADWRADNVEAELRLIAQRERRKRSKYAKLRSSTAASSSRSS